MLGISEHLTLVQPSIPLPPNNGVCLFQYCLGKFSDPLFSELAGGSKRVSWTDVTKQNEWYVDKVFLIPGTILGSPARIPEADVQAYWIHWYNLSKSGNTFTFRKTTPPKEKGDGAGEGETELEEDVLAEEETEDLPKKSGKGENPVPLIPQQCGSDGEKITFLRTLIPDHKQYQAIINILAPMSVSPHCCLFSLI